MHQAGTAARRPQFRPEHTSSSARAFHSKAARLQADAAPAALASANVALIEAEFRNSRRLYEYKLRRAGIASHELQDALCEVFSLAVQWAGSFDATKSSISSWLGNQVVRTVASSLYGTRRPGWRHQQEHELSTGELASDLGLSDAEVVISGFCDAGSQAEDLAVAAFLNRLAGELTATETAAFNICGTDLLHQRQPLPLLVQIRDLLGVRSLATVRNFTQKLRHKVRALALEHFHAQDLMGRPGFDKLVA